eukprot:g19449.t1
MAHHCQDIPELTGMPGTQDIPELTGIPGTQDIPELIGMPGTSTILWYTQTITISPEFPAQLLIFALDMTEERNYMLVIVGDPERQCGAK